MKKRRRMQVTVETERLIVVAGTHGSIEGPCEVCGKRVKLVPVEAASAVSGLSQRAIFRDLEAGLMHFLELPGGKLLICLDSLLKHTRAGTNALSGPLKDHD